MKTEFIPKLWTVITREGITKKLLASELVAGLIVGIVALPLSIAFAIASGVSPEKGIITAIIGGFVVAAFGGSRVQIGGPTGAFIVIVFGVVQQYGISGLMVATLMAGVLIIIMGIARFGNFLKFVPHPLVVGFTSGIALIIFSSQVNDLLGLGLQDLPGKFIPKWKSLVTHISHINLPTLGMGILSILIIVLCNKMKTRIPGTIIAIVLGTLAVRFLGLPIDTIETRFGEIPSRISMPDMPKIDFAVIKAMFQPALAIALLGGIESLLSAVVSDGMIGGKHRPNMELVAQGGANILSALFGGIPVTGAIARTATNVKNGGRTPIAGIVHSCVLLLTMLFFAPFAKLIPLPVLAGILVVVSYNMSEWRQFKALLRGNRIDIIVLLTTFLLTVFLDLTIAIQVGIVLSSLLFMNRMSESLYMNKVHINNDGEEILFQNELGSISSDIVLYELDGPLFFGAAQEFQNTLMMISGKPKVIILRMRYVPYIDATGYQRLNEILRNYHALGVRVLISGIRPELSREFESHGVYRFIRQDELFTDISLALEHAKKIAE